MAIKPKPFLLKCPKCGWSKVIKPKADTYDESWGIKYLSCPKCNTPTNKEPITSVIDTIIAAL